MVARCVKHVFSIQLMFSSPFLKVCAEKAQALVPGVVPGQVVTFLQVLFARSGTAEVRHGKQGFCRLWPGLAASIRS